MTQVKSPDSDTAVATDPATDTGFRATHNPVRCVTAAALFDGHDASINVIRRLLQAAGAEVIHLGHDRSVDEIVRAAIQEDAQAIAISSYQGGHMEFLRYTKDLLAERGAPHIKIWAGGGGTIVPREVQALHDYGISRVFTPGDGRQLGLHGMIQEIMDGSDFDPLSVAAPRVAALAHEDLEQRSVAAARFMTLAERPHALEAAPDLLGAVRAKARAVDVPVLGITGPGGAGKSSYVDELILRFLRDDDARRVAVISVDPTKRRTGGALLGDRIRMNTAHNPRVFMRSVATRGTGNELAASIGDVLAVTKAAGFDFIILESSGIGQAGSAITDIADVSVYVMTPEYGAASQLEKIDMLDLADVVVVNKFDRRGAEDAHRDVRKQFRRGRDMLPNLEDHELPVFGTVSAQFNDDGVTASYLRILRELGRVTGREFPSDFATDEGLTSSSQRSPIIPAHRQAYLAEVSQAVRHRRKWAEDQVELAREWDALERTHRRYAADGGVVAETLARGVEEVRDAMDPKAKALLDEWPTLRKTYESEEFVYKVRDREFREPLVQKSLAGTPISRVVVPNTDSRAAALRYLLLENVPGRFPFTAGVFPLKRRGEEPKRMFAGEGGPDRTNTRFHYLCKGEPAKRLSTAFDSVTLYGRDPGRRPDIYGKIGETGVSICTLDDMKRLYAGFDLCDPSTSVSMTINGPAPMILAMFLNTAIDQQVDAFREEHGRIPDPKEHGEITAKALTVVRGTVQADILKEDQAQNTCIFSTPFALKMMGDIQQFFVENQVRNYYSVSISGYHIAEAGANPITQLAFTLANGFTYVEYYLSRGMDIDTFAPNLSFFFSNGLDPEYTVIGRVARRIWSVAMRDLYEASERSQKLKYHVQTSGRSLHAMEVDFNDIRTTLQALLALQDNCNSLHTNAYDEAVTTPTEESVRRAMAIQLITNREFGWSRNENPLQGSLFVERLTDQVEAAVLTEFDRISERGGVLGAMETQYQRGRIQEESLLYERLKHSGELPVVGVNCFLNENDDTHAVLDSMPLSRSSEEEKDRRITELQEFQQRGADDAETALRRLQDVALGDGNIFAELMRTVRVASLGQVTDALFDVGGRFRRNL